MAHPDDREGGRQRVTVGPLVPSLPDIFRDRMHRARSRLLILAALPTLGVGCRYAVTRETVFSQGTEGWKPSQGGWVLDESGVSIHLFMPGGEQGVKVRGPWFEIVNGGADVIGVTVESGHGASPPGLLGY